MKCAVVQSYGWRAASCLAVVEQVSKHCDQTIVLAEDDYAEADKIRLRAAGATVVDCPVDNRGHLAHWFRWKWLDSFIDANQDAHVLMIDDDRLVLQPEEFFDANVDFAAVGGLRAPTRLFVWCGVTCFRALVLKDFAKTDAFVKEAAAVHTDEILLNRWLWEKGYSVGVTGRAPALPPSTDQRSLRFQPDHMAGRKEQFMRLRQSGYPDAEFICDAVGYREWLTPEQQRAFLACR